MTNPQAPAGLREKIFTGLNIQSQQDLVIELKKDNLNYYYLTINGVTEKVSETPFIQAIQTLFIGKDYLLTGKNW